MGDRISESGRLKPSDIVAVTPAEATALTFMPRATAISIILTGNYIAVFVAHAAWPLLRYAVFLSLIFSFARWYAPLKNWMTDISSGIPLEQLRLKTASLVGHAIDESQVSGIEIGTWVYSSKAHKNAKALLRSQGFANQVPEMSFRLCVAKLHVSGVRTKLGFSDGTTNGFHPASYLFVGPAKRIDAKESRLGNPAKNLRASEVLADLMRALATKDETTFDELIERFSGAGTQEVLMRALRGIVLWGLAEEIGDLDSSYVYRVISKNAFPGAIFKRKLRFRLTSAGRLWLQCSPESLRAEESRKHMENQKPPSITFSGPMRGIVNTGPVYGQVSYIENNYSERSVLDAIDALLRDREVPWHLDELREERAILEMAAEQEDTTDPGLRPALSSVFAVIQNLGLGVLGNSIYDVLKHFITSMT